MPVKPDSKRIVISVAILILMSTVPHFCKTRPRLPVSPVSPILPLTHRRATGFDNAVYLPLILHDTYTPALINPDFELGDGGDCRYYDADNVEHHKCFTEQFVPFGWTLAWHQDQPDPLCRSGLTGRPEANLSDLRHLQDVYSGEYSAHAFTFYRCASFRWEQAILVSANTRYEFGGMVRTWFDNSDIAVRLCVDAVCSSGINTAGQWMPLSVEFDASSNLAIVYVECFQVWPSKNGDCWADATRIQVRGQE